MTETFIFDALRTPFGKVAGALSSVRPDDLAAHVMKAIIDRVEFDTTLIDDVIFGDANQAGEDNRNVARMGLLLAGIPTSVPGATVNRLCASSVEAVIQGSRAIQTGEANIILAGGVESMSRAPFVVEKSARPWPAIGNQTLWNSAIGWRMTNKKMPSHWTISNGEAAEKAARDFNITRSEQDAYALRSHLLAAKAWADGIFDPEVIKIPNVTLNQDEGIRADTTQEQLAGLKPLFASDGLGSVTAGNSSSLNDGASAVLLGNEQALKIEPLARIVSNASHGVDPENFPTAPIEAANKALKKAGKNWDEIDFVELNEAFASQVLACLKGWPDLDPQKVNIHGGALAIGHPLGASGARIIGHAAHELKRRGSGTALVAICIGVGQGLAVVLER